MSYQSSDTVYRAQRIHKAIYNVYRANSGIKGLRSRKLVLIELPRLTKKRQFLPKSLGCQRKMWQRQFLPSSLGCQRKMWQDSFYRAHSVIKGNLVLTEFTRRSKDCYEVRSVNRVQLVNTGIIFFWTVFTEQGRPIKGFVSFNYYFQPTVVMIISYYSL